MCCDFSILTKIVTQFIFCFTVLFSFPHSIVFSNPSHTGDFYRHEIKIVNMFSGCFVHVINYPNRNIDFSFVATPIIFLRYFSFTDQMYLFPKKYVITVH